jgi:hypothetical protein
MATKVIDNFTGRLSRNSLGDMNSGFSKYTTTFGNDPFSNPSNLTWLEAPIRIDPNGTVITDLIMAARPRLESGITYVYAVGHTGRLYKIQVNSPNTYNPNFDNPVLLATLTAQSPTFTRGASIQFYGTGASEKLFIGHDRGVTKVNFSGTSETFVGTQASYTSNVPRPSANFNGKLYFGNGTNLVEIDSTELVISYGKLSPGFPDGTQVRDIDVSPEGTYAQIVVTRVSAPNLVVATQDTASLSSADSYLILWNGIDAGYTSYSPWNSYSLTSNISYGPFSYTMGYDSGGAAIYSGGNKIVSLPNSISPTFNSMLSTGNMLGFGSPENSSNVLKGTLMYYGQYDNEIPPGLFRLFRISATTQTDIAQMPVCAVVSNLFYGASSAGYTNNQVGSAKVYFSTLETDSAPTTTYKFYKFTTVPTGLGTTIGGVYETQNELFSKKVLVKEIRVYVQPMLANNSFKVDLIGSDLGVLSGSSSTFTVGTNVDAGQDYVWYNPQVAPTYTFGLRITNLGSKNMIFNKVEIDYTEGGK